MAVNNDVNRKEEAEVAVIGAGVAGLSAALTLGRACRRVVLFDHGPPRNAPAPHAHGLLTRDGASPDALRREGLRELGVYDVEVRLAEVTSVERHDDGFEIVAHPVARDDAGPAHDAAGRTARGAHPERLVFNVRAVVLATGVRDLLPEIPGLSALWGDRVVHCPYCDGWERRNKPLAVLGHGHETVSLALLLCQWTDDVRLVTNGESLDDEDQARLASRDIPAVTAPVREIVREGDSVAIRLEGAGDIVVHSVFAHMEQEQRSQLPASLGCALQPDSHLLQVSEWGETSVAGVYAAGDLTTQAQQVSLGIAAGARAAIHLNHALIAGVPTGSAA